MALAASGPKSAAPRLIPGSLGTFEAISAGLAELADLDPGSGFRAALVLRILTCLSLLPWMAWSRAKRGDVAGHIT
jgi:hypothetical protein